MKGLKFIAIVLFAVRLNPAAAQEHQHRFESLDVQHYRFELALNDSTNRIEATASVSIRFLKPADVLVLDLVSADTIAGTGMKVESVVSNKRPLRFDQQNNKLLIHNNGPIETGEIADFSIKYAGIPADGLIISNNRYGDRTFFGDNWPDRAQYWLPCVDHPSDKASVEFIVTAPAHYKVVANGKLSEETFLNDFQKLTHWKEDVPISTKVMVIGVADFEVGNDTVWNGIPVNAWVFKENAEKGLENYRFTTTALDYFSELIGPYSYEKLAHVQSKTRYGGMENASCIFYSETSAISNRSQENLFAHEVAHQWFGNSATEQNWHHIWLSEGFATYLTHVYTQHFYGEDAFRKGLILDRERVIAFAHRHPAPIIDTSVTDYSTLLNTNSYQKAGWFLHMLRQKLGDETFFNGLRNYYARYRNSTALTSDFRKEMEKVSGKDLTLFFDQWLLQAGHPAIRMKWVQEQEELLQIEIIQTQLAVFDFPLEIQMLYGDGSIETKTVQIDQRKLKTDLSVTGKVQNIKIDPNIKLLFEDISESAQ